MASSIRKAFLDFSSPVTKPVKSPSTPASRGSLTDEMIWERLKEAGFDEETIKRRDKAALIAYITKLETELHEHQHHMGLLLLERKELATKYEQAQKTADSAESIHKRSEASQATALAEARKREENLKRLLAIEKECVANMEKTLHEVRKESAAIKLDSEAKLAEAKKYLEDVEKKYIETEMKQQEVEMLQEQAGRYRLSSERMLKEIEAREDDVRRRLIALQFESEAKEKEISFERQCLSETKCAVQKEEESLAQRLKMLNEREENAFQRSRHLEKLEQELNRRKVDIDTKFAALEEEKSNLEMKMHSLEAREEGVIRREALVCKKEQELLILKEKLLSKEYDEIQKLSAEYQAGLEVKRSNFEAELALKQKLMDAEIETKRQTLELWEANLREKEEQVGTMSHEMEKKLFEVMKQQKNNDIRALALDEKEQRVHAAQAALDIEKMSMQRERGELTQMKLELMKCKESLESETKLVLEAQEKLKLTKNEREELQVLQIKLKDEIDSLRAQKMELAAKAEELKVEKEKFEANWQVIDEKNEELRQEAKKISEEREALSKLLEDERNNLIIEKDHLRKQFKKDEDALLREQEEFMNKMRSEYSEWLTSIQRERENLNQDVQLQKIALENHADKRREEIEAYLREREEALEVKKVKELEIISSQKELAAKELEHVSQEVKRLEDERAQIALDREEREQELAAIRNSIEELQLQREKLQEQRDLLHKERESIQSQIKHFTISQELNLTSKNMVSSETLQPAKGHSDSLKFSSQRHSTEESELDDAKDVGISFISTKSTNGSSFSLGVKKRSTYSSFHPLFYSSQNYKKRREGEGASEFHIEGKTSNCEVSTQQHAEDQNGLNSSNPSLEGSNWEDSFLDVPNRKPEASCVHRQIDPPPLVDNGEHLEDGRTIKEDNLLEKVRATTSLIQQKTPRMIK